MGGEFEQKMENEKRDKLRGKNEGECDEEGTIGRDVEERVGAKDREWEEDNVSHPLYIPTLASLPSLLHP